jgi:hypothetical protein
MLFLKSEHFFFKSMYNLEKKITKNVFMDIVNDLHEDLLIIFEELEYLDETLICSQKVDLLKLY